MKVKKAVSGGGPGTPRHMPVEGGAHFYLRRPTHSRLGRGNLLDPPSLESCLGNIVRRCTTPRETRAFDRYLHGALLSLHIRLCAVLVIIIRFFRPEFWIERGTPLLYLRSNSDRAATMIQNNHDQLLLTRMADNRVNYGKYVQDGGVVLPGTEVECVPMLWYCVIL